MLSLGPSRVRPSRALGALTQFNALARSILIQFEGDLEGRRGSIACPAVCYHVASASEGLALSIVIQFAFRHWAVTVRVSLLLLQSASRSASDQQNAFGLLQLCRRRSIDEWKQESIVEGPQQQLPPKNH